MKTSVLVRWGVGGLIAILAVLIAGWIISEKLSGHARERVAQLLEQHFGAKLQVRKLEVRLFPTIRIQCEGLVFSKEGQPGAPPLITIRQLSATASIFGALRNPPRVQQARLDGLRIQVSRRDSPEPHAEKSGRKPVPDFIIDRVNADGTILTVFPKDKRKQPLEFDIRRLQLQSAGTTAPMSFRATLVNAEPPGEIHTTGQFGPWNKDDMGKTPVMGSYTFRDADLSVFRGIAGKLASDGKYRGVLERIEVDGWTDVPDFTVKVSGNPVDLKTRFHAVVDGTNGDTSLDPVEAQFGSSHVTAHGDVQGEKGVKGKTVSLDVAAQGRLEDMLLLGTKGQPSMNGAIRFQTKLKIPPGDVDIARKLQLAGTFAIDSARFTKLDMQQKIGALSRKGLGKPDAPSGGTVASDFAGQFALNRGELSLRRFSFHIPGAGLSLNGNYGLVDQHLDFHGTVRLAAKISETTTGIKSFLLKAVDPLFKGKNAGAVIPIKITGTRDHPAFGLDIGGFRGDETGPAR